MKTLTKANIEQLADEIKQFLDDNHLQSGVCIYYNNRRLLCEGNWDGKNLTYKWIEENLIDPHDYFEYAAWNHIISMSFEGGLYDVLNYTFGRKAEQFQQLFEKYGLFWEMGNAWNLTAYPIDDNMEVEYTYYNKPNPVTHLYYYSKDTYPEDLSVIMEVWFRLSTNRGDSGSCVLNAGFEFEYNNQKYFMHACSPHQGSLSWETDKDLIAAMLKGVGAINIGYDWGNMD